MTITHYAPVLGEFSKLFEFNGNDPGPVFTIQRLGPDIAKNPQARMPYAKVEALWAKIIALIDDPYIGLRSAELWCHSSSGALG